MRCGVPPNVAVMGNPQQQLWALLEASSIYEWVSSFASHAHTALLFVYDKGTPQKNHPEYSATCLGALCLAH
jgi:hypothetical protein